MITIEIYDKDHNKLDEVYKPLELDLSVKLNDYGECTFRIDADNPALTLANFKLFNHVKVVESAWWVDKTYFYGYMKTIKFWLYQTVVHCRTLEHKLERRKVRADNLYISNTLTALMTSIFNEINSYHSLGLTLDCTSTSLITLEVKKWQSFLQTLKDIAKKGFQFKVTNDRKLLVADSIGIDRSVPWDDYVELTWEDQALGRNIKDTNKILEADDLANGVMGKDNAEVTDATSITTYWLIEDIVTSSGTGANELETMTQQLADKKDGTPVYEIDPDVDDFFFADLGDQIKVVVDTGNETYKYEGAMIATEKRIRFDGINQITIKLSTNGVKLSKDLVSVLQSLNERITRQELV